MASKPGNDEAEEQQSDLIRRLNQLDRDQFKTHYVGPAVQSVNLGDDVTLTFHTARSIPETVLKSCRDLIRRTSSAGYKKSSIGWSPSDKLAEMKLPDMKFLVLTGPSSPVEVLGFLSFMLCCEDELDVIYCYEVHLVDELHGRRLGYHLMRIMEQMGRKTGVEKAMLTVFTANRAAIDFYHRLGYEWYDEEPPPPRKRLRGRTPPAPKPTYVILAMDLQ